ncbi:MAG: hypothetical protein AVDCRST_MAG88-1197, partial [uncultured Thermomicrobiales bacterium]
WARRGRPRVAWRARSARAGSVEPPNAGLSSRDSIVLPPSP